MQLLPLPESYRDIKPGTMCKVAGWGVTSSEKLSKYLQETTLKIFDRKICEREYRKYTKVTSNILCAGGKSRFSKRDAYQVRSKVTKRRLCAVAMVPFFTVNKAALGT